MTYLCSSMFETVFTKTPCLELAISKNQEKIPKRKYSLLCNNVKLANKIP